MRLHPLDDGAGGRNVETVLAHAFEVERDGLGDHVERLFACLTDRHASGKVGHVHTEPGRGRFEDDGIAQGVGHALLPLAWRRILDHVPGGKSLLSFPGIVTRPGNLGCLNCRQNPCGGAAPSAAATTGTGAPLPSRYNCRARERIRPLIRAPERRSKALRGFCQSDLAGTGA